MTEKTWRGCEFGGPETIIPVGDGPSRYCEARSYGPRNGKPKMHVYVCPEDCATCHTPAFVEAVRAWDDIPLPARVTPRMDRALRLNKVALALLPKDADHGG